MEEVKKMVELGVNMLAYTEINLDADLEAYGSMSYGRNLMKYFKDTFNFAKTEEEGTVFFKDEEKRVLACIIKNKNHVYPALKHMLFERE